MIYDLNCPNFKKLPVTWGEKNKQEAVAENNKVFETSTMEFSVVDKTGGVLEEKEFHLVLLRFFRDLSSAERFSVLNEMGAIPKDWTERLTHTLERAIFDKLVQDGKLQELHEKINQLLQQK